MSLPIISEEPITHFILLFSNLRVCSRGLL